VEDRTISVCADVRASASGSTSSMGLSVIEVVEAEAVVVTTTVSSDVVVEGLMLIAKFEEVTETTPPACWKTVV
jgi:hypothetical protein